MNIKEMRKIQNIVSKYTNKGVNPTTSINTITDTSKKDTYQKNAPSQTQINKFLKNQSQFEK